MREEAHHARALAQLMTDVGLDAEVSGDGVHWQVDVALGPRGVRVHCFHLDPAMTGLMLGMNPANARMSLSPSSAVSEGAQYLVRVSDAGKHIAEGRTPDAAAAVMCAVLWLQGKQVDSVALTTPFLDEEPRLLRQAAETLHPSLQSSVDDRARLTICAERLERWCEVRVVDEGLWCSFRIGQAQAAALAGQIELHEPTRLWLVEKTPVERLALSIAGVRVEPHAQLIESDPAQWHWLRLLERIQDPEDVLAPLRDFIEALSKNPTARRFYSYSSFYRFCLSASSHYPWVDEGLPIVERSREGAWFVDEVRCASMQAALEVTVKRLETTALVPFFGSAGAR